MKQKNLISILLAIISLLSTLVFQTTVKAEASIPVAGDLVLSEINWIGSSVSASDQWVEIYNTTTDKTFDLSKIVMSGVATTSGTPKDLTLKNTLSPGGSYVISNFAVTSASTILTLSDQVDSSVDLKENFVVIIKTNTGTIIDTVNNSAKTLSRTISSGKKPSLVKISPKSDSSLPQNWRYSYNARNFNDKRDCTKDYGSPKYIDSSALAATLTIEFEEVCTDTGEKQLNGVLVSGLVNKTSLYTIPTDILTGSTSPVELELRGNASGFLESAVSSPSIFMVLASSSAETTIQTFTSGDLNSSHSRFSFMMPADFKDSLKIVVQSYDGQSLLLDKLVITAVNLPDLPYSQSSQGQTLAGILPEPKNLTATASLLFTSIPDGLKPVDSAGTILLSNPFTGTKTEKIIRRKDVLLHEEKGYTVGYLSEKSGFFDFVFVPAVGVEVHLLNISISLEISATSTSVDLLDVITVQKYKEYSYEQGSIVFKQSTSVPGKIISLENNHTCSEQDTCTISLEGSASNIQSKKVIPLLDFISVCTSSDGSKNLQTRHINTDGNVKLDFRSTITCDSASSVTVSTFNYANADIKVDTLLIQKASIVEGNSISLYSTNKINWDEPRTFNPKNFQGNYLDIFHTGYLKSGSYIFTMDVQSLQTDEKSGSIFYLYAFDDRGKKIFQEAIKPGLKYVFPIKISQQFKLDHYGKLTLFLKFAMTESSDSIQIHAPKLLVKI